MAARLSLLFWSIFILIFGYLFFLYAFVHSLFAARHILFVCPFLCTLVLLCYNLSRILYVLVAIFCSVPVFFQDFCDSGFALPHLYIIYIDPSIYLCLLSMRNVPMLEVSLLCILNKFSLYSLLIYHI